MENKYSIKETNNIYVYLGTYRVSDEYGDVTFTLKYTTADVGKTYYFTLEELNDIEKENMQLRFQPQSIFMT